MRFLNNLDPYKNVIKIFSMGLLAPKAQIAGASANTALEKPKTLPQ